MDLEWILSRPFSRSEGRWAGTQPDLSFSVKNEFFEFSCMRALCLSYFYSPTVAWATKIPVDTHAFSIQCHDFLVILSKSDPSRLSLSYGLGLQSQRVYLSRVEEY